MTDSTQTPQQVPLTLADLRAALEELAHLPGDTPVVVRGDAEGNRHSPLWSAYEVMYEAETAYSGETYPTPEEIAADPRYTDEDEAPEDAVRAVVLTPMN